MYHRRSLGPIAEANRTGELLLGSQNIMCWTTVAKNKALTSDDRTNQ